MSHGRLTRYSRRPCSYVLEVVKKAERNMIEKGENKEYLPIQGLDSFRKATADLLLGSDSPAVKEVGLCNFGWCVGTSRM